MREVLYKKHTSVKNRRRVIAICEKSENKDVITNIHRTFIYMVAGQVNEVEDLPSPVFQIIKNYNTKTKEEKFSFRVKGSFYVIRKEAFLLVHFCHSLKVDLLRKSIVPAT